jgi:hypothetical protein
MSNEHVLVLNQGYQPLYIEPWTDSVKKVKKKKAEVLSEISDRYLRDIHTFSDAEKMPVVIRLMYFMYPPSKGMNYDVKVGEPETLSRAGIWERDKHICQYCGKHLELNDMHWDHILPESKGNPDSWMNLVCACSKCNTKKKDRTPEEAGMKLIRKPYVPLVTKKKISHKRSEVFNFIKKLKDMKNVTGKDWLSYIYMHVPLEK